MKNKNKLVEWKAFVDTVGIKCTDFSNKSEEMRYFFKKRGYPDSVVNTGQHRAQQIDRQSALQTSQKEKNERIPFTLTYHPHNLATKNVILKNFKLFQNENETGRIFSQPHGFHSNATKT